MKIHLYNIGRRSAAASGYFDREHPGNRARDGQSFTHDDRGRPWLRTGDIKSGGEWISSLALEEALMGHEAVREAVVVARPDPVFQERPVAFVILRSPNPPDDIEAVLRSHLARTLAKWQIPDEFIVVEEFPHGSTGKVDKAQARKRLA